MVFSLIRTVGVTAAALTIAVLGINPAAAATDSGWVPDGPYDPYDVSACGTTVTIADQVNQVERRTRVDDRGNTRTDYRGKYVVRVTTADGRRVVLDNSGPYSDIVFANGDEYIPVRAPALLVPVDDTERAVFRAAGLPAVFYYTSGRLDLFIHDGVESVIKKPKNPVSLCRLLHR